MSERPGFAKIEVEENMFHKPRPSIAWAEPDHMTRKHEQPKKMT